MKLQEACVPVNVYPCLLLSRKLQMICQANIEQKQPRLFSDLYLVKKEATKHLKLQPVVLQKHVCVLWANIAQVVFLCNFVSDVFQLYNK